jgi:hypothetical protein
MAAGYILIIFFCVVTFGIIFSIVFLKCLMIPVKVEEVEKKTESINRFTKSMSKSMLKSNKLGKSSAINNKYKSSSNLEILNEMDEEDSGDSSEDNNDNSRNLSFNHRIQSMSARSSLPQTFIGSDSGLDNFVRSSFARNSSKDNFGPLDQPITR